MILNDGVGSPMAGATLVEKDHDMSDDRDSQQSRSRSYVELSNKLGGTKQMEKTYSTMLDLINFNFPEFTERNPELIKELTQEELDSDFHFVEKLKSDNKLKSQKGGLSGAPLRKRSTEVISLIHKYSNGNVPIIGVGGIMSADDALEKLNAGASLIQVYTGFIYNGPSFIYKINREIIKSLN